MIRRMGICFQDEPVYLGTLILLRNKYLYKESIISTDNVKTTPCSPQEPQKPRWERQYLEVVTLETR